MNKFERAKAHHLPPRFSRLMHLLDVPFGKITMADTLWIDGLVLASTYPARQRVILNPAWPDVMIPESSYFDAPAVARDLLTVGVQ